nr:hypothetical protein [Clostridium botulinum]
MMDFSIELEKKTKKVTYDEIEEEVKEVENMNFFTLNILIGAMAFIMNKINDMSQNIDPFEAFNDIQNNLDQIDNEKVTNFVNGLINASMSNPSIGYFFMFLVYMTPILNLLLLTKGIVNYFNRATG